MTPSQACIDLVKASESCRLTAYEDVAGLLTIGWGNTADVQPGEVWTQEQADEALAWDVEQAGYWVTDLVKVPLTQGQFDALTDFVYNLGAGNLKGSTLLRLLNAGNYAVVPYELYHDDSTGRGGWIYAGGEIQPGLVVRRQAETALWNSTETA